MPIRSELRYLYGPEWRRFSRSAIVRCGLRCQRCTVENCALIRRAEDEPSIVLSPDQAKAEKAGGQRVTKVILAVAHLDQDPTINDPQNLAALCHRCHLAHDKQRYAAYARQTRRPGNDSAPALLATLAGTAGPPSPAKPREARQARGSLKRIPNVTGAVWYAVCNDGLEKKGRLGLCSERTCRQAKDELAVDVDPINALNRSQAA